jgi:hypothetical protein
MINLNPPFYIYEPPTFLFGGIEITPPYRASDLTKEMSTVLRRIANSFSQAYEIDMKIKTVSDNFISTQISPLTASINRDCKDFLIGEYAKEKRKLANIYLQHLMIQNGDGEIFTHDKGLYVILKLKQKFDPITTELLIRKIKSKILTFTYNKFRISSTHSDNILRIDAEIIPPDTLYIV